MKENPVRTIAAAEIPIVLSRYLLAIYYPLNFKY